MWLEGEINELDDVIANQDAKVRNQLQDLDSLTKFPETQFDVPFFSKTIEDRMNQILISNKPSEHTQMVTKGMEKTL